MEYFIVTGNVKDPERKWLRTVRVGVVATGIDEAIEAAREHTPLMETVFTAAHQGTVDVIAKIVGNPELDDPANDHLFLSGDRLREIAKQSAEANRQ